MPAPHTAFPKIVEIFYREEADTWLAYVFNTEEYTKATEENPPYPIDAFASMHETILLSRIKEVYEEFEIKNTDGEVKSFL